MASNPKRGEQKVELGAGGDRKTYTIRLDFNALCLLEEMHGRSVMASFSGQHLGLRTVRDGLYVGLIARHPELTPAAIGELMDETPERFSEWAIAVQRALIDAMGRTAAAPATTEATDAGPLAPRPTASTSTN